MNIKLLQAKENEKERYGIAAKLVTGEFKSAVTMIETNDGKWTMWMESNFTTIADLLALGYKEISEIQQYAIPNQSSGTDRPDR